MDAAERDALAADDDQPGAAGAPLGRDGFCGWSWRRSRGPGALQPGGLLVGERVGAGAQQLPGVGVKKAQRGGLDADREAPAGEDLGGEHLAAASETIPALETVRSTSTASLSAGAAGSGGDPAAIAPLRASCSRSAALRCERRVLTQAPPMSRWMASTLAQKRTVTPARAGPSQN